jgi:DNA-binding CsgD family transcriptional regulator
LTIGNALLISLLGIKPLFLFPLILVVFYNLAILLFKDLVLKALIKYPYVLLVDVFVAWFLLMGTGGFASPYYLYNFGTLLFAGFFYKFAGAFIYALLYYISYLLALHWNGFNYSYLIEQEYLNDIIIDFFTFVLVAGAVAYPATIIDFLEKTRFRISDVADQLNRTSYELSLVFRLNPLTKREIEVLKYISQGKANKEIATKLFISEHTVRTHLNRIYKKLGVSSRVEAALYYRGLRLSEKEQI